MNSRNIGQEVVLLEGGLFFKTKKHSLTYRVRIDKSQTWRPKVSLLSRLFLSLGILEVVTIKIPPDMTSTHFYYSLQVAVHKKEDIFYVLDNSNKK